MINLNALFDLSYGLYVVSSICSEAGTATGCIANSVMQVTAEPPTIAVSINHDNFTNVCIKQSGRFAISVLPETIPPIVIGTFGFRSGRDFNKFKTIPHDMVDGLAVLKDATSYLILNVIDTMETNTHTVFLGKLEHADQLDKTKTPMTYTYYHKVVKGKTPKNATTYQAPEKK